MNNKVKINKNKKLNKNTKINKNKNTKIKESKEKLNDTLLYIVNLLIKNNLKNWFIGYGTLLGIIRENSCIDKDDDIDIIIDKEYFNKILDILKKNNIQTTKAFNIKDSNKIIKTVPTDKFASIDFYCADYNENNTSFNDTWEKVLWTNCKINNNFIKKEWNNVILNIPYDFELKLKRRYGETWMIPQDSKGIMPRLKII